MEFYCVMVKTGEEETFKKAAEEELSESFPECKFYSFQRKLRTNQGKVFDAPLFPGYAFFCIDLLNQKFIEEIKKVRGFYRILYDNNNPVKLYGKALEEMQLFIRNGEHWGISRLQFLPGKTIRAISGPLVGLEGKIIAVNKKKKRVTVQSTLLEDGKRFDLLYEDAEICEV